MSGVAGTGGDREILTELVLRTFRLNGLFLHQAEELAKPAGLTAAWWQVLGAVLPEPLSVAGIARDMGLARQSVQRTADLLAENGLTEYLPNPAHARARLVAPTAKGWSAIGELREGTVAWARTITDALGEDDLRRTVAVMDRLIVAMSG
jgi:DNA-binding MarR family transcriptional regulator